MTTSYGKWSYGSEISECIMAAVDGRDERMSMILLKCLRKRIMGVVQ